VDSQILEEYGKVLLVSGLNKETLTRLDSYISMTYLAETGAQETTEDRLASVGYHAIISFLQQSNLTFLANNRACSTKLQPYLLLSNNAAMGFETSGFFSGVTVAQLSIAGNPLPVKHDPWKDRGTNSTAGTNAASPGTHQCRYHPSKN
jgi:hypothetical protein